MNSAHVLFVGGDDPLVENVRSVVASTKHTQLEEFGDAESALARAGEGDVGLILIAVGGAVARADAERLVREAARLSRPVPCVVLLASDEPETALAFWRAGVAECLSPPLNLSRLALLIELLTVRRRVSPRAAAVRGPAAVNGRGRALASNCSSPPMETLLRQVRRVAELDTTILLTGETGSGKTLLARMIHDVSRRRDKPFLSINCGALSPALIESEMFGHVRGAFTGADRDHRGKLSEARDGTLLLDEIDSLPLELQAKLLRAVDERLFEPVGSSRTESLQARLIVASSGPLEEQVEAGRFRPDLFYRLNVISLNVPPLRDRREEIPELAIRFVAEFATANGRRLRGISPRALEALVAHDWPGNVRELHNYIERAAALAAGPVIDVDDLPENVFRRRNTNGATPHAVSRNGADTPATAHAGPKNGTNTLAAARSRAEREQLVGALERNNFNRTSTAIELGISRTALYKKLHKFSLM